MRDLPSGTVTFLFTDIEGSTSLLNNLGDEYAAVLAEHRRILRSAFTKRGGVEVDTQGDAFFYAFTRAGDAVKAASEGQDALAEGPLRVRIGVHTGEPLVTDEGYVGLDVHRAARIAATAHGGQVVISQTTRDLLDSGIELRELGAHRLKDLVEPQRLYQLGFDEYPPLRSLNQTNLPIQLTPLIGREHEVEDLLTVLRRDDVRLLTLTGAGGTGKTRLALQVAAELVEEFEDGVFWVSLAWISDPELIVPTIAQTLGVREVPGESLPATLVTYIDEKRLLLLLDNFEQVLGAAPAVAEMLAACPMLELLVTSRECLHVSGEWEYPLQPLVEGDAVALFSERARAAQPDFKANAAVGAICRALDGLPLAIELAAARVKVLQLEQILARLEHRLELLTGGTRDSPERQRTLRATIGWSYDLLDEEEQSIFARLAVFVGGCTLAAAEQICMAELDTLHSLVDKSLLRQTEGGRFSMLETIREYATERLDESSRGDELRRRHVEHYLALAEDESDERTWLARLAAEHDNVRAALIFQRGEGEPALLLRFCRVLGPFWFLRGYWDEGRTWLEDALALAPEPTVMRGNALRELSSLEWHRDLERGRAAAEEAIAIFRALGDEDGLAGSLTSAGTFLSMSGATAEARVLFEEAAEVATRSGNRKNLSMALGNLGSVAFMEHDYEGACDFFEQVLEISRTIGHRYGTAVAISNLGMAAFQLGHYADALTRFQESLVVSRDIEYKEGLAYGIQFAGAAFAFLGDAARSARLMGYSEVLHEELASKLPSDEMEMRDTALAALRRQLGERLDTLFAEGQALAFEEAIEAALAEPRSRAT
ncbi:MAG: tetratricopeptide repeat protein [Actinomycetota bacterium]